MINIISLIFFLLAASCNAVMDILKDHWSESIFGPKGMILKESFWYPDISWGNKYVDKTVSKGQIKWKIWFIKFNKLVVFTDAWHLFKGLMIMFLCISVVLFNIEAILVIIHWYHYIVVFIIYGVCWNLMFSCCYDNILRIDKY